MKKKEGRVMPANIVKPGQEKHWEHAKAAAAQQGHADDYAYIVGIFKRMVGMEKSMEGLVHTAALTLPPKSLEKSLEKSEGGRRPTLPAGTMLGRSPGGVPNRREQRYRAEIDALAAKRPPIRTDPIDHVERVPTTSYAGLVQGMALPIDVEASVRSAVEHAMGTPNEVEWRGAIYSALPSVLDHTQKQEVLRRARELKAHLWPEGDRVPVLPRLSRHDENLRRSEVFIIPTLMKAEPRGGSYHRRVPKKSGKGYRYFYDKESYDKSSDAHHDGDEATDRHIEAQITKQLGEVGKVKLSDLGGLVKKHGADRVGGVLKRSCGKGGTMKYAKGCLSPATKKKKASASDEK